jgi:hypothetical protein
LPGEKNGSEKNQDDEHRPLTALPPASSPRPPLSRARTRHSPPPLFCVQRPQEWASVSQDSLGAGVAASKHSRNNKWRIIMRSPIKQTPQNKFFPKNQFQEA